jgi:hypothetical protein
MRKTILIAAILVALSITATGIVYAFEFSTPQGFQRVGLLIAAGKYKTPSDQSVLVPFYQHTLMGWTDAQVEQQKQLAINYFNARFGLANTNPGFGVFDPKNNYRVYSLTGSNVPSEGWVVRDGSFTAAVTQDTVLHGTFGGPAGILVPAGTAVTWGYYNILVTRPGQTGSFFDTGDTIIVHFESQNPIIPDKTGSGTGAACHLVAPWGDGLAQLYFTSITTPDGFTQADVRNVWTFPGLGPTLVQN